MAEQIALNIVANTQNANQNINTLNSSIGQTAGRTVALRTQLRQMTNELQGLEVGSRRFNELSLAAGELRDHIGDVNNIIRAGSGTAVENLTNGLTKATQLGIAGFQGLTSAQALFGSESKEVQETLLKIQAIAGLSSALGQLGDLRQSYVEINASLTAFITRMTAGITVSSAYTASQVAQTAVITTNTNITRAQALATSLLEKANRGGAGAAAYAAAAARAQTLVTNLQAQATTRLAAAQTAQGNVSLIAAAKVKILNAVMSVNPVVALAVAVALLLPE